MQELGGMLAAAILKVVGEQIGSVIKGKIKLHRNFNKDLEKMKMALESVEALLEDAERRSIMDKSTRLWLKRLKDAMYAISDMIDEFEADTQVTRLAARKFSLKKHLAVMTPCLPIGPKITLANKMKTVRENLEEITGQHERFNLCAGTNTSDMKVTDKRETSSNMEAQIFGRNEERDTILASLSQSTTKDMVVLPIYGIGGLGKTTLAQMVYNSSQFKDYSQVWVYVSQTFDLKKIGNSTISQLSEKESQYTEMQMIHNSLSKLFADKKILIVLDDLWEDKKSDLNKLKAMLKVGKGSKVVVIVTTRDEGVAREISSIQPYKLAPLTNDMCWAIIKHKSDFKSRDDKEYLKQVGKDIASKCGGVVLAAQALGYMLQSMTSCEWKSVRDSDIWSVSDSEDSSSTHVIASLRLSYSFMHPCLKLCFAYCAIFPKGHKIVKDDLIRQWVSLGFIEPTNVSSSWELGERYIRQLLGLSFLQDSKSLSNAGVNLEDITLLTMHDLVHDLARSIMVGEILVTGKRGNTGGSCYHYALLNDCSKPLESSKIRALRFMDCEEIGLHHAAFSSAKSLRVLDLSECSIHKLPDSIGKLKQLRYLNAPRIQDGIIPNSVTRLSKLIYLNLHGSSTVSALPESIGQMEGLMYLDLSYCSGIVELPESLAGLKKLVHLDLSNCSRVRGVSMILASLTELQHLNLSYCPNIGELPGALGCLSELLYLNLSFSSYLKCCQEAEVLSALTKLEYLDLSSECCDLRKLPEGLGSLVKLKYLNLSGCQYVEALPRLFGNLKDFVHLDLSNCPELNGVPKVLGALTKLQYLNLSVECDVGMMQYREKKLRGLPEVIGNLTKLRYLNLSGCMHSIFDFYCYGSADGQIDFSSRKGQIDGFMYCISTLSNLVHLDLSNNSEIYSIPGSFCELRKLHTLDLSRCWYLVQITESIRTIDSLKFLYLNGCQYTTPPQLCNGSISLPCFVVHAGDGEPSSNLILLQHTDPAKLEITRLENVKSAEEAHSVKIIEKQRLEDLELVWTSGAERFVDDKTLLEKLVPPSTLKKLEIRGYNGVSFPAWLICHLPNLQSLVVRDMESLEEWNTSYSRGEEYLIGELEILSCPKLRMKAPPPRAIKLKISDSDNVISSFGECTMSHTSASSSSPVTTNLFVEYSKVPLHQWRLLHHLPDLTHLCIQLCGDLTGSSEIIRRLSSLETLSLDSNDQKELPKWLGQLTSLQKLDITRYPGLEELPYNMRQLTKLQSLTLCGCESIRTLPHWFGELTRLTDLKIHACKSIRSLPNGMQQLTNLQILRIAFCPLLKQWCESGENEMELAHIKQKEIYLH